MEFIVAKMSHEVMVVCGIIAVAFLLIYGILLLLYYKKYSDLQVDSKIFTLNECYFLGLGAIEIYEKITHKKITSSQKAKRHIQELIEVFGRESADLYYYIETAGMVSMLLICVPLGFMAGCVTKLYIGLIFGILFAALLVNGIRSHIKDMIKLKKEEIEIEFPQMISKMTLLINAGMPVRRAWDEVATSNWENKIYEEMRVTSMDIQQGSSIEDAVSDFAQRCAVKEIRKFASLYIQAVQKGPTESIRSMKEMSDAAWKNKKELARQKGATASQKLTIPNMLMFLGLLILVVGPMSISMMDSFPF